jgi:hypothetical protein
MENIDFFFVYDYNMQKYLSKKGHKFITHARSIKTGREFWLFIRSNELQKSIDEFTQLRKKDAKKGIA